MLGLERPLGQGRLVVTLAQGAQDVARAQALRHQAFHGAQAASPDDVRDADGFDRDASHVLVSDQTSGQLLCCFRLKLFEGTTLGASYGAQFYDLTRLAAFPGRMLEMGRFCLAPGCHDPDVLRLAWAAITRIVDAEGAGLLFGCSSFAGADPVRHGAALGALVAHVAPLHWRPERRAPETVSLSDHAGPHDPRAALAATPALLRTYLGMGAWVSDHAVIDRAMNTLHVLTGVEIDRIPPARARLLRAIAAI